MSHRTDWFRQAKWGVFTHYLAGFAGESPPKTADEWNVQIDAFDVDGLVAQLQRIGALYYFMTIGQNSGFFCSPNETYDSLVDRQPSRLSRRDLIAELAEALTAVGIRLMVYLPSHAPADDVQAIENLSCLPEWSAIWLRQDRNRYRKIDGIDDRLSVFQRNWEAIIREWSQRWGDKVHGWWIDGCYYADEMYRHDDAPNFRSFAEAMRAGNPNSIVAFNPGVEIPVICYTEHEDYTAGEIAGALPVTPNPWDKVRPIDGFVDTAQYHILTYLGEFWGSGRPRLSKELLAAYTRHINNQGGVITWDVPILRDGLIDEEFVDRLAALNGISAAG